MHKDQTIGGLDVQEIRNLSEESLPPTEAGTSILTRFARSVCELIERRVGKESGPFAAFLLSKNLRAMDFPTVQFPLLKNGNDEITGRIWWVTYSLGNACHVEGNYSDQATIFSTITSHGWGDHAAITVDWRSGDPIVTLYSSGINNGDHYEELYLEDAPINAETLKVVLDRLYNDHFRNPIVESQAHQQRIWQQASAGVPVGRPEEEIHGRIFGPLKTKFPNHDVRSETPTDDGRADLSISKWVRSLTGHVARRTDWLLELKALCDMTSTGNPKTKPSGDESMQSGLEQILGYRKNLKPIESALCCYDMRATDVGDATSFSAIRDRAQLEQVWLWRWYLHRSAEDARRAEFGVTT